MTDADLPGFFHDADNASQRGQRLTLTWSRIRLFSAIAAGLGGALEWKLAENFHPWAALALVAFSVALVVEILLWTQQPEREWYAGRAVAESIKTLAWRYAVAGAPFSAGVEDPKALLRERVNEVIAQGEQRLPLESDDPFATASMAKLRAAPFEERRKVYLENRLQAQKTWYAERSKVNRLRAMQWRTALVVGEVLAVVLAGGRAFGLWEVDLSGMLAAALASGAAWLGTRRHSTLATSYSLAARELVLVRSKLLDADEASWDAAVAEAEETISREHQMWLASRPVES
ncbi:hypothetical protein F4560_002360 [Saccharothrix ecbatanensis]|uniref:DUF4231 domain-containing protein n=1 Tax=Saccharothrix ecbatanensis TaxID=1105145 RepID=A0A7W9HHT7_9PSEU|nr:DUF4231 domain-containing protein [Saccharothrix ecbatanensis]MBB5802592.1 hypothetical protein [Saccharothrix ecbatanensis]